MEDSNQDVEDALNTLTALDQEHQRGKQAAALNQEESKGDYYLESQNAN